VLDQRLVRENPELITAQLGRRGKDVDLTKLQLIAQQQRDLEQQRSNLQAEGNRIGKEVGQRIKSGADPKGDEVAELRQQGNAIKQKVAVLEEEEKQLSSELKQQLLGFPNLPSEACPDGRSEDDNVEVRRWGTPRVDDNLDEHWQIAERLQLFDTERSVRIAQACLVLIGRGCFDQWAGWAEAGIATAGTATEQLVGLGIPALSLPGPGPQFKPGFARRQSRLLGGAVRPCSDESELTRRLEFLLDDPTLRSHLGRIGTQRMGPAGGSDQLARLILDRFNGY